MAEDGGGEKKHAPTERRLRQAAEKGNVKRSQDFPKAAVTCAMVLGAMTAAGGISWNLANDMTDWFTVAGVSSVGVSALWLHVLIGLVGPIIIFLAAISTFTSLMSGGWVFSVEQLSIDFSKILPSHGLGQIFSVNGLVETGKNLLKVLFIGGTGALIIFLHKDDFAALAASPYPGPWLILNLAVQVLLGVGIVVLILGTGDLALQYWMHRQSLRMTDNDMREEMKDIAGNPHVKSQQRRLARKISKSRQMKRVPEAAVIITNPTHFAVALQYRRGTDRVPMLLAKGVGLVAEEIMEIGRTAGVPIVEMPPLARAVYWYVEPDEHIPESLYRACAEVMAYVWRMQAWRRAGGVKPKPPRAKEGEIPMPGRPPRTLD